MADTLTIVDNRTGKKYDVPITDGTIRAMDLRQIRTGSDDFGMMTYDPAFMNTAACRSAITFIDGDEGVRANQWHTDVTFVPTPPAASVLIGDETPADLEREYPPVAIAAEAIGAARPDGVRAGIEAALTVQSYAAAR